MVINNKIHLLGAVIIIFFIGFLGFCIITNGYQNLDVLPTIYKTKIGSLSINANIPDSPSNIILYRVAPSENDMVFYSSGKLVKVRPNVTSEADAPHVAEVALIPYGGLPQGAKLASVETEYIDTVNIDTHQVTVKHPVTTNVQYTRYIDAKPVVGDGGSIYLDLGNNGELVYLNKIWRTVSPAGSVPIINASAAIEKIKRGDVLGHPPKCACQLNVDKIGLGYYENGRNETQEYLEPVWIFSGTLSSGGSWNYYVYARESVGSSMTTAAEPVRKNISARQIPENNFSYRISADIGLANTTVNVINIT
jgi:hypothetical protein